MPEVIMLDTVELDDQFEWEDEFEWDAVAQAQDRSLSGALVVQYGSKTCGRPITLKANGGAWTPLSAVRQLEAMRDEPGRVMQLTLADARVFHVMFNRDGGTPLEARPIERLVNPPSDHPYDVSIRLITVAAG